METASIAAAGAALQQGRTQDAIQATVLKQQFQGEQAVVDLLAQAAAAAPSPGTGTVVDKFA